MHLLLLELLQQPYDSTLLEFMRVDEMLIDIGDDLTDYEDDVVANSFNIFRGRLPPGCRRVLALLQLCAPVKLSCCTVARSSTIA
jgi:hypothetical protein